MYRKVNEDFAVQDTQIAQKILNTDKEINKRLTDIAQKNKEIAILKQQRQALEDQALKAQKATVVPTEKPQQQAQAQPAAATQSVIGQPPVTEGIEMPSLSVFLNEEENEDDDEEDKPRYVPYFHDDRTGYSYIEGKPRYRKYTKEADTPENEELNSKFYNEDLDLRLDIGSLRQEYKQVQQQIEEIRMQQDQIAGEVGFEIMDALGSGADSDELVAKTADPEVVGIAQEYEEMMERWNELEEQLDNIRQEISEKQKELDNLWMEHNKKVTYEDAWEKIGESVEVIEYDEDYDILDGEDDDGEKNEDIFFIRIPPENDDEEEIIAKVFREDLDDEGEEDGKWYIRDVEDTVDWITDLVFEKNYSKPAIMAYLADILGEVEEISEEEYNDVIDDKEENDDEYYD